MLPKNKVLQISDVSVPHHILPILSLHIMGDGFYMLFPDKVREEACVNMQEAWEICNLKLKYGDSHMDTSPSGPGYGIQRINFSWYCLIFPFKSLTMGS